MMIGTGTAKVLLDGSYVLGLVGGLAAIGALRARRSRRVAHRTAVAAVVVGVAGMIVGFASAYWVDAHSIDVVVVRKGDSGLYAKRYVQLGGTEAYRLASGGHRRTYEFEAWVVNESSRPVRIKKVKYEAGHRSAPEQAVGDVLSQPIPPFVIPPGTATAESIDYIGPDAQLPDKIETDYDPVGGIAVQHWLTWDR